MRATLPQVALNYCVLGHRMALLVLDKEWEENMEKAGAECREGRHWWPCGRGWGPPRRSASRPTGAAVSGLVCRRQWVAKDCLGCGHDLGRGLKQGGSRLSQAPE